MTLKNKKILFIIHAYIDYSFLLPYIIELSKDNKIVLLFLNKFDISNIDSLHKRLSFEINKQNVKIQAIKNNPLLYTLQKVVLKLDIGISIIKKILLTYSRLDIKDIEVVITDFTLRENDPFLKKEILKKLKSPDIKKISFVHSISIARKVRIEKHDKDRSDLLNKHFDSCLCADKTFEGFLKKSKILNVSKVNAIRFSDYYMKKIIHKVDKNAIMQQVYTDNGKFKEIILHIDGIIRGDEKNITIAANEFHSMVNCNKDKLFICKIKPRRYKSIVDDLREIKLDNLVVIENKYTVEELSVISDKVIGRLSSALIFPMYLNKDVYIYSKFGYSGTYLDPDDIDNDATLNDILVNEKNKIDRSQFMEFMKENNLLDFNINNHMKEFYEKFYMES